MPTFTSRLGLRKPDYTDVEEVGIDFANTMDAIDALINYAPFTSNTRPVGRRGQLIYETDTGNCLIYTSINGVLDWHIIANDMFPKGRRGYTTAAANSAIRVNGDFLDLSVTFTAELGRRYIVEVLSSMSWSASPPVPITQSLRWAAGGAVTIVGALVGSAYNCDLVGGSGTPLDFYKLGEFVPNVAGSVTVGMFNSKAAGAQSWQFSASATKKAYMVVRDWGV